VLLVEQELATIPEHPGFGVVRVTRSLALCMFCRSLFVLLSFFSRTLFCLTFFDFRTLITPLVSSNSSNVHCRIVY
jgi:hypothetical protein